MDMDMDTDTNTKMDMDTGMDSVMGMDIQYMDMYQKVADREDLYMVMVVNTCTCP
jgi:hypothetical protein